MTLLASPPAGVPRGWIAFHPLPCHQVPVSPLKVLNLPSTTRTARTSTSHRRHELQGHLLVLALEDTNCEDIYQPSATRTASANVSRTTVRSRTSLRKKLRNCASCRTLLQKPSQLYYTRGPPAVGRRFAPFPSVRVCTRGCQVRSPTAPSPEPSIMLKYYKRPSSMATGESWRQNANRKAKGKRPRFT